MTNWCIFTSDYFLISGSCNEDADTQKFMPSCASDKRTYTGPKALSNAICHAKGQLWSTYRGQLAFLDDGTCKGNIFSLIVTAFNENLIANVKNSVWTAPFLTKHV